MTRQDQYQPLARPGDRLRRAVHGRPGCDDRERCAAVDPERACTSPPRACSGSSMRTRSCSAAFCCSAAAPPICSDGNCSSSRASSSSRPRRSLNGLATTSNVLIGGRASRASARPLLAAPLCRSSTTTLCRSTRTDAGARRLERDRRGRRRRRPRRRRLSDGRPVVALGFLHQPADRDQPRSCWRCATSTTHAPRGGPRQSTSQAPSR